MWCRPAGSGTAVVSSYATRSRCAWTSTASRPSTFRRPTARSRMR
nr:MAG TPA: hypothetical protein [Caudoviricetes sp.]